MDHIRQFDWCKPIEDNVYFVKEEDIKYSAIESILSNTFHDPMLSSDSESEDRPKLDLSGIFKRTDIEQRQHRVYVPCFRPFPAYPKLSALTRVQHLQCLKVLCAQNPEVLKAEFIMRPSKLDQKVFEEVKAIYTKEQEEYIEWAKTMWANVQCMRALRPKPPIEMIYEAEFKLKANELQSFPKNFEMAAQIPLESGNSSCQIIYNKDLISVSVADLPQMQYPELTKLTCVQRPYTVPEPCDKHPCRFMLPNEGSMSILPVTEVHRELAQYAVDHGAQHVASEKGLRCLVEMDKSWTIPLSVCQVNNSDGEKCNVIVIGSDFSVHRECAQTRTYKAYRHMLEYSLIVNSASQTIVKGNYTLRNRRSSGLDQFNDTQRETRSSGLNKFNDTQRLTRSSVLNKFEDNAMDMTSDDDEDNLIIDAEMNTASEDSNQTIQQQKEIDKFPPRKAENKRLQRHSDKYSDASKSNEFYKCTCQDSVFANPPPRSFKKWQIRNTTTHQSYGLIVHTSHKARGKVGEVILEPIPEYQLELGGTMQSEHKVKSLALSLLLRRNASLLNVRLDGPTGEVVALDNVYMEDYLQRHGDVFPAVADTLFTALHQLHGLLPGNYLLQHEPSHGKNALLYATQIRNYGRKLSLHFDCSQLAEADEAKSVKTPPTLAPVLLPIHKFRKILPCAFTPHEFQVAKEPKKPVMRQKTPPQAIKLNDEASDTRRKWPRRGKGKKKRNNRARPY